jgi:hypothetical protein
MSRLLRLFLPCLFGRAICCDGTGCDDLLFALDEGASQSGNCAQPASLTQSARINNSILKCLIFCMCNFSRFWISDEQICVFL